jgi:NADH-quinone oxidoreductase subunit L
MTHSQETIRDLLVAATLMPLASSVVVIFLGRRWLGKASGWFATAVVAGSFACSLLALGRWLGESPGTIVWNVRWIPTPGQETQWLYLGALIDGLTVAMMTMVTGIAMLVHLYSIGYMEGDKRFERFFAYMSLFTFSMLGIVISNSVTQLFVFWELVGLTSYLLIGFWFERHGPQQACKKAFVMNRIGDAGFLIGFGILFSKLGGNVLLPAANGGVFDAIRQLIEAEGHSFTDPPLWLTVTGIALFFGAIGKSAQFPLHTWLPDAMEGPTPVSSIVHSATMVAAGVYLTGRIYPILTPGAHLFIATIGLITLAMAACMALVMTDIKRVLAYSTLSQLGYMILGLGAGAYAFALYHLITHAFFKCCLFQCSGSVIHAAHHQQDMRSYGGLWRKLPVTAVAYLVCTLAIAGASIPYTDWGISGFYSKDGIIAGAVNYSEAMASLGGWAVLYRLGPMVVAYVTVFYMARSFALTFLGAPRDRHLYEHAHEAPWTMVLPQVVLAAMAILSAPFLMPIWLDLIVSTEPPASVDWVQRAGPLVDSHAMHTVHAGLLYGFGWILSLGAGLALYIPGMRYSAKIAGWLGVRLLYTWAYNKFYFDALYDVFAVGLGKAIAGFAGAVDKYLVDGLVNLAGGLAKVFSWLIGIIDDRVVDGVVNGAAAAAQGGGRLLRVTHAGRVRGYVLALFATGAVVTLLVVTVVVVSG